MSSKRGVAHRGYVTKRNRVRQSVAISEGESDYSLVRGVVKRHRSDQLLLKLNEILADPKFDGRAPPWLGDVVQKLRSGNVDRLCCLLVNRLGAGVRFSGTFIGPVQQRKPKAQREVTRKWIANREALETMQANRPLKPPGR